MNIAAQLKLCINCKHIGRNGSGDATKFKCFAADNISCEKVDLVTGEIRKIVKHENCYLARIDHGDAVASCGPSGKWFEPAPPKLVLNPHKSVDIATDLLSQLSNLK